jgi:hypothetical protein
MPSVPEPNALRIKLHTNIPEISVIDYNENMTIVGAKENNKVFFNPLLEINRSIAETIPVDVRQKQFFSLPLFQALTSYLNSKRARSTKTLADSISKGFIDNNIQYTLDKLFPEHSVITINKSPYTIISVDWNKGDWIIDTKDKITDLINNKYLDPNITSSIEQGKNN